MRVLPLVMLLALSARAQTPGSCAIGRASGTLDANDVEVTFPLTGGVAYGPGLDHAYYVPKDSRLSPLYAASVWMGGTVEGEFRVAGSTYGQGGVNDDHFEFWPGPLDPGGTLPDPTDCAEWDRIWVVSVDDVAAYEAGAAPTPDLRDWPVGLGAGAVEASGRPVAVTDRRQTLDLAAGQRPVIYGTQTAFWVMNDVGNVHRTTESVPLGLEVAVTAFEVSSASPALNQSVVMRYRITNRSPRAIEDFRLSMWADPDLGNAGDDYVGTDTTRSMVYVYNADEPDDGAYGFRPPAFGVRILGGQALGGPPRIGASVYFVGSAINFLDPRVASEYQRIMEGVWRDGTPITARGTGYEQGGEVTPFVFPGDPTLGQFWSEERRGTGSPKYPNERRFALSTTPFRLPAGETANVDLAWVFARGDSRLGSVRDLFLSSDTLQTAYADGSLFATQPRYVPPPPTPPILAIDLLAGPNPARERLTLRVRLPRMAPARLSLYDARGRALVVTDRAQWPAGQTEVEIPTASLAPGTYLARLDVRGGASITRTITVVR